MAVVAFGDNYDFLGPANRVKAPVSQIIGDGAQPTLMAVAELAFPHAFGLCVPQSSRIDMVYANGPERSATWCNETPTLVPLFYYVKVRHSFLFP